MAGLCPPGPLYGSSHYQRRDWLLPLIICIMVLIRFYLSFFRSHMYGQIIPSWDSCIDLLAARIHQLMHLPDDVERAARKLARFRFNSTAQFEKKFMRRLQTVPRTPGALVLIRNSGFDGSISGKALTHYFGPFIVHSRTRNSCYSLTELDGTGMRSGWVGFRLLPDLPRVSQ